MNDYARQVLDPGDQAVLLGQAAEALASRHPGAVVVELPTGIKARMCHGRWPGAARYAGGVVRDQGARGQHRRSCARPVTPGTRMFLPGLVGSGALWLRGCHQVQSVHDAGEWLALEGEPASASWPCAGGAPARNPGRPVLGCWTRPDAADRGWMPRRPARAATERRRPWSSGTSTGSPAAAAPAGPCSPRPGGRDRRSGRVAWVAVTLGPRRPERTWPGCCGSSRAPWSCRRCATTSRTCTSWCRSSSHG